MRLRPRRFGAILAVVACLGCGQSARPAASPDPADDVVLVYREPMHRLVFQSPLIRVLDVRVPPGETTGYHVHADRMVGIAVEDARIWIQSPGARPGAVATPKATPHVFDNWSQRLPYTHRVANVDTLPLHYVVAEWLAGSGADGSARVRDITLEPGAATAPHTHDGPGLVVQGTAGTLAEEGGPDARGGIGAGSWSWRDAPGRHVLRNDGATRLIVYEIDAPRDEVTSLVARYDSAWNRKDTAAVARLIAPQYQYFSSLGGVEHRASTLEFLASPEYHLERAERSEVRVTHGGPAAVVSSRWKGRGTYRGKQFVDDQRCGQVWVRAERTWQVLSEHCVQIAPDPWATSDSAAVPKVTNLVGTRDRPGLFTQRLVLPAGYCGPIHTHDRELHGLVLRGILQMAVQDSAGGLDLREYPAGSFVPVPAGRRHVEGSPVETEIHLSGIGPVRTTVVDSSRKNRCVAAD